MKTFADFLGEQGVTSKFIRNFHQDKDNSGKSAVGYIIDRTEYSPGVAVNIAFVWEDTNEGYAFWNKVAEAWGNFMVKHGIPDNRRVKISHIQDSLNIQTQKQLKNESN